MGIDIARFTLVCQPWKPLHDEFLNLCVGASQSVVVTAALIFLKS